MVESSNVISQKKAKFRSFSPFLARFLKGEGDLPFHARFHFLCGPFVLFLSEQYFGMMFDVSASFPVIRMGESSSLFHAMKSSLGPFSQFDQGLFFCLSK